MTTRDIPHPPKPAPLGAIRRRARQAEILVRQALGLAQPEARLAGDAQTFWESEAEAGLAGNAHWRGAGAFAEDERWQALGLAQIEIFDRLAPTAGLARGGPLGRVLEWGCGGGMNAVHFAPRAERGFVGVDVARPTLDQCARQLEAIGLGPAFTPVLVGIARPEAVLDRVSPESCDLFICLHVFELFPTPEYGLRVLGLAHALLREGGAAFVQIRFDRGSVRTAPRRWNYARNLSSNATYRAEAFWEATEGAGFTPQAAVLVPYQRLNQQSNYAYFLMTKGSPAVAAPRQEATIPAGIPAADGQPFGRST